MQKFLYFSIIWLLLFPFFSSSVSSTNATTLTVADYIFTNGDIITIDDDNPGAEAMAIENGVIVAIGSTASILGQYTTQDDTYFDLGGQTIMPGIINGHTHYMASMFWNGYDIEDYYPAQEIPLSYGITSLTEKSVDQGELAVFQDLEQDNKLRLRVNCFVLHNYAFLDSNNETIIVERWYQDNDPILNPDGKLRIPGVKIFADGYYGNRGHPAMSEPYPDNLVEAWGVTSPYGHLYLNQTELNATVKRIQDKGYSCAFHAMGDRGIETVLNAIDYSLGGLTNDEYRHQIEHNTFIRVEFIEKAIMLNTIHALRGYFPTYNQKGYEELLSPTWLEWYINRYSFTSAGVHTYMEIDDNVNGDPTKLYSTSNINPFLQLWGFVTRKAFDVNGTIHEPVDWLAETTITIEEALKVLTIEGAYAVKQENQLGSLEVGKYADLIFISDNPKEIDVDQIKDIQVLLTMVDGQIEYERDDYSLQSYVTSASSASSAPSSSITNPLSVDILGLLISSFFVLIVIRVYKRKQRFH